MTIVNVFHKQTLTLLRDPHKCSVQIIWLWCLYLVTSKGQHFLTCDWLMEGWLGFCGKLVRLEVRSGSPDGREMVWNFSSVSSCVAPDFTSLSGTLKRSMVGWQIQRNDITIVNFYVVTTASTMMHTTFWLTYSGSAYHETGLWHKHTMWFEERWGPNADADTTDRELTETKSEL